MKTTKCKGCDADMIWAVSRKTGAKVPLSSKPVTVYLLDDVPGGDPLASPVEGQVGYISHFVNCPAAAKFSKKKENGR